MCTSTTTNPAELSVTPNTTIHVFCVAHASYYQQVILSFKSDLTSPIGTFSGTGENVAMTLADGTKMLSVDTATNTTLYAKFNFSTNGSGGPFSPAVHVCTPIIVGSGSPTFTTVTSEDQTDNDDNDSYLTVVDFTS